MSIDLDLRERAELCDLFDELGPEAPTLSGAWTTADLAAHLAVREGDLLGAPGILIPPLAGLTDKRMAALLDRLGYAGVVDKVRNGPPLGPMKIPAVRRVANLIEYYVHHEDVRRANGSGPRTDRPDLEIALWDLLGRMAPLMVRKAGVGGVTVRLVDDAGAERTVGKGDQVVTITGTPGELVLELYGRRDHAEVTYEGDDDAVAKVKAASFGI
ncbi:MAG: TIGR03085 family protein [Acidimicrobiales bacterium]|nr:TIGR03085 family protein [Acidimicrobiales bacterium]